MRQIGEIRNQEQARLFIAFLVTKEIAAKIEQEGDDWEVWVKDEDRVEEAADELEAFLADPNHSRYSGAISKAMEIERQKEQKRREMEKNIVKVSESRIVQKRRPLTLILIFISAGVALLTSFGEGAGRISTVYQSFTFLGMIGEEATTTYQAAEGDLDSFQLKTASIADGEVWRLITPIFIHYGSIHIVFNMLMLFSLGTVIEDKYGTFKFGLLVLISAALSNFAQAAVPHHELGGSMAFMAGPYLNLHFGGMSGVVYALFGFIWMKSTYDRTSGIRIRGGTVVVLLGWLFFCMTPMAESTIGSVANWAHGVGLLVGMGFGILPRRS